MSATDLPAGVASAYDRIRESRPDLPGVDEFAAGAPAAEGNGEAPSSLIAALRAQHRKIGQRTSVILDLPFWEGKLGTRYRYLDERSLDRLLKIATGADQTAALRANVDLLVGGCDEVLGRRDDGDDWAPLVEGEHLRYDQRLAELLQLDVASEGAREVVYALFRGRLEGAMAIGAHATRYIEWLQGQTSEVVESLVGESPASGS